MFCNAYNLLIITHHGFAAAKAGFILRFFYFNLPALVAILQRGGIVLCFIK